MDSWLNQSNKQKKNSNCHGSHKYRIKIFTNEFFFEFKKNEFIPMMNIGTMANVQHAKKRPIDNSQFMK